MARKVIYQLVDDLDGQTIKDGEGETIQFGLDGTGFEIDLSAEHATQLREALAGYIAHARTISRAQAKSSRARPGRPSDLAAVRAWAKSSGHQVSDRGRIPTRVLDAYKAAKR